MLFLDFSQHCRAYFSFLKRIIWPILFGFISFFYVEAIFAKDLLGTFKEALMHDPTYQKATADLASTRENIPLTRSYLLPEMSASAYSAYNKQKNNQGGVIVGAGGVPATVGQGTFTYNANGYTLDVTQVLFDYAAVAGLSQAKLSVHAAEAAYTAALQDLMRRTAAAYFDVLAAEDNLRYIQAQKKAIIEQLSQVKQEYKVGSVAITGVYQAQAAYDSILSEEISAANAIINARSSLQTITGSYDSQLASLKYQVPLFTPKPTNPKQWIATALNKNYDVQSKKYTAEAYKKQISIAQSGHYPELEAYAEQDYQNSGTTANGQINTTSNAVGIELNLPIFQGGRVNAQTRQAADNYESSLDVLMQTERQVQNDTEQSYNNVVSGINRVIADRQAIVSNASSLSSTIAGFKVGSQTMLDVLQAQQNLYNAESQFSADQYAYINASIDLKEAAGVLNYSDLVQINAWLSKTRTEYNELNISEIENKAKQSFQNNLSDEALSTKILKAGGDLDKLSRIAESE